ncbi:MAG: aconitate hydratase AcnA [Candidatus Helarchaeota archaeon]
MGVNIDPFQVKDSIKIAGKKITIYRLDKLEELGIGNISHLPNTIKILLESVLRQVDGKFVTRDDVEILAKWNPNKNLDKEIPFKPARVILQDFTGVPAVVDLAAMRSAMKRLGKDPDEINPIIPADLIIDHSIQVDHYGNSSAINLNEQKEFERNRERYTLLRWAQNTFDNFRVIPPSKGIIHQINLEYLASVVQLKIANGVMIAYPDTVVGTDSHTTTINGLGVLGWGVGGIEAEAVMLGQPYYMPIPEVIGFKLYGELKEGVTATDLVLTITQKLRAHGVVGKFVEFFGPGIKKLSLPDRATISNMAPEYGATCGFFPIDEETLNYLLLSGRKKEHVELIRRYLIEQGLFLTKNSPDPVFSQTLELDLNTIEPSVAGYKRPQDRIPLNLMKEKYHEILNTIFKKKDKKVDRFKILTDGSVVIAAITSCTNTSNPSVLIGAGLLAKKAVELGLTTKDWVKTSLAPGSRVVIDYLQVSGLLSYLEKLGFYLVGYGCTTCIGNSGPLKEFIIKTIQENNLIVASVSSGNRNFEGRISPYTKINYLMSPPLVVAYALAGTIDIDFENEAIGYNENSNPIYLRDIWPKNEEIKQLLKKNVKPEMFDKEYSEIFEGTSLWKNLTIPKGKIYEWDPKSTYIREPPFFIDFPLIPPKINDIKGARALVVLGDSTTTDHISPAGAIPNKDPAGKYLISQGIEPKDFNSFGSRRGNHEVMMRGTFGNIRLRNKLTPEKEGSWTIYFPTEEEMSIYDAAMQYIKNNIPLIVIAGKEYGTGSSRDWAAKGTQLLGVKAVIAESYERIHRSNLVGMGVLPLQFTKGENFEKLGLKGNEIYDIMGLNNIAPGAKATIIVKDDKGKIKKFEVKIRLDTLIEVEYCLNGGILHTVLRNLVKKK